MTTRARMLAALSLVGAAPLVAQGVMIAPTAVFIDHRSRSGSVLLYNPNPEPAEVTISLVFGYPATDSAGNIYLKTFEAVDSTLPSAAAWLQAFPRRLNVLPLERQTVRVLASPPPGLPDGEYWARLVIAAKGGQLPVSGVPDTAQIQVGLTLEVRSVIGVYYRKGAPVTGVRVSALRAAVRGDTLEVRPLLTRQGSAAFLGTVRGQLVDSTGVTRAELMMPVSVYYALEPRITTFTGVLPPGRYRVRITVEPEREDLDPRATLPAAPVSDSVEVIVP